MNEIRALIVPGVGGFYMTQPKTAVLVASKNDSVRRFIEAIPECYRVDNNINDVYVIATTLTIDEFKKVLESHAGTHAAFFICEVSSYGLGADSYFLADKLKNIINSKADNQPVSLGTAPTLRDPYATTRLDTQ